MQGQENAGHDPRPGQRVGATQPQWREKVTIRQGSLSWLHGCMVTDRGCLWAGGGLVHLCTTTGAEQKSRVCWVDLWSGIMGSL